MNKPKLNMRAAGIKVSYSHIDKGHWIYEYDREPYFVKTRKRALEVFSERVAYHFGKGLRVV